MSGTVQFEIHVNKVRTHKVCLPVLRSQFIRIIELNPLFAKKILVLYKINSNY